MLYHEESPEKSQYNMATSPFLDTPNPRAPPNPISPFCAKFKRHDIIKCLSMKQEIHFTEQLGK